MLSDFKHLAILSLAPSSALAAATYTVSGLTCGVIKISATNDLAAAGWTVGAFDFCCSRVTCSCDSSHMTSSSVQTEPLFRLD